MLPPACLSSPCLNGGSCHLIVATGTTVCACPPDYAGRLCNIGELPSLRAVWAPRPAAQAHRTPTAHSARPALLRGDWHRVPRRGQHSGLRPQLPGLELRPALPGAARGLRGCRGPPGPGPPRLLPVSTVPTVLTPLLGRLLRERSLGPGLRTTCRSRGFWGGSETPHPHSRHPHLPPCFCGAMTPAHQLVPVHQEPRQGREALVLRGEGQRPLLGVLPPSGLRCAQLEVVSGGAGWAPGWPHPTGVFPLHPHVWLPLPGGPRAHLRDGETEAHHNRAGPRPCSGSASEVRGPRHSALCPDGPHRQRYSWVSLGSAPGG